MRVVFILEIKTPVMTAIPPVICESSRCSSKNSIAKIDENTGIKFK